ncbi:MAG: hypothetical protein ACLPOO_02675 [Terriglobales bacterium]
MASEKALYWMAVGLLTFVMGSHFVSQLDGRCFAAKSRVVAERISGKADRLMAMADVMLGRTSTRFDRAQAAFAMTQVRVASMQTSFARQEAACARLSGIRARMVVQQQLQQMQIPVVCPRQRVELVIPAPPASPSADPI